MNGAFDWLHNFLLSREVSSMQSLAESVTLEATFFTRVNIGLTKLARLPMTCAVSDKPLVRKRRDFLFARRLLTRAGNFSPVAAEHQLLDVIGDGFTERQEAHA